MDQMTLDEAIEHAEERAAACNDECGREHEQLAGWLRELRDIRKAWSNLITAYDDVCKRYNDSDARHVYTINYLYGKIARVNAENEKLRELVLYMFDFFCTFREEPHTDLEELKASIEAWKRMQELGIEVDDE